MKVAVIGARTPSSKSIEILKDYLNKRKDEITEITTGGALGADTVGMEWAIENGKKLTVYTPNRFHNFNGVKEAKDKGANIVSTGLGYNDRNTLVVKGVDLVVCSDYGNGTVDALRKAMNDGITCYTTGSYTYGNGRNIAGVIKLIPKTKI